MHKKPSCSELPNSFEEAIANGKTYTFDPVTKERIVYTILSNGNSSLRTYESGLNELTIFLSKGIPVISSFGFLFGTADYLKQTSKNLYNSKGEKITKSSLDDELDYYINDNKVYGLKRIGNITISSYMNSDSFNFINTEVNHYKTPNSKLRKERKEELKGLKATYTLEHTICPKSTVIDYFDKLDETNWKNVLDQNEALQLSLINGTNSKAWYVKKLHSLINDYVISYVYNPTEYIIRD